MSDTDSVILMSFQTSSSINYEPCNCNKSDNVKVVTTWISTVCFKFVENLEQPSEHNLLYTLVNGLLTNLLQVLIFVCIVVILGEFQEPIRKFQSLKDN